MWYCPIRQTTHQQRWEVRFYHHYTCADLLLGRIIPHQLVFLSFASVLAVRRLTLITKQQQQQQNEQYTLHFRKSHNQSVLCFLFIKFYCTIIFPSNRFFGMWILADSTYKKSFLEKTLKVFLSSQQCHLCLVATSCEYLLLSCLRYWK